jgi:N6-adenosine-specific RNA methylase IME4
MDYPMMSLDEIKSLNINSIAADNSWCFLWTIQRYVPDSFDVLKAWGFKYARILTWDKGNGMCLHGFHNRSELIVVGYKGKIEAFPRRKAIPTVFKAKSERHSAKPDEFYEMLKPLGGKRIDIFARKEREGWDVWGNETMMEFDL